VLPLPRTEILVTRSPSDPACLIASAAVNEKVNFQPSLSTVPAGYTADSGAAYSEATGRGWVREDSLDAADHVPLDVSPNTRERNAVTDQRH